MSLIVDAYHKIGTEQDDIQEIYVHVDDKNEIDKLYVLYNNSQIERVVRPREMKYADFKSGVVSFLESAGANSNNKNNWLIIKDKNDYGIDFSKLDDRYLNQEEIKKGKKEYRRFKVKVVKNIMDTQGSELKDFATNAFSSGVLTIVSIISIIDKSSFTIPSVIATALSYILMYNSHNKFKNNLTDIMNNIRNDKKEDEKHI